MKVSREEVLISLEAARTAAEAFAAILDVVVALGFEYCGYVLNLPLPLSSPRYEMVNNYPEAWKSRYGEKDYIAVDPSVRKALWSTRPGLWTDELFAPTPQLWREAQEAGLRHGWFQSCIDKKGVVGILTLARSGAPISRMELVAHDLQLRWLVQVAHQSLSKLLMAKLGILEYPSLTEREVQVLRWTADGKTTGEISNILAISENTVNFHIKNAVQKLQSSNKTAAVVRAAVLGLLH
jgi:LuxR family transcriptional regulator